jgi:hypothetical protein
VLFRSGCDGDAAVVPAWAQPLPDGAWLLRLHEVAGRHGSLVLHLATGWQARSCAADGSEAASAQDELAVRPYQILSLRLETI